jgi:hypothetical protein
MDNSEALETLSRFRRAIYDQVLGQRKDSMFELMEAVLVADRPANLVHLSLEPVFRRRWPSAPDALAEGSVDVEQLRDLIGRQLAAEGTLGRPVWAVDGTVWPRPAAEKSPERTWAHRVTPGRPQSGIVPGWEYQWLVDVPEGHGSWVRPLDVSRRRPSTASPTLLALEQLRHALAYRPCDSTRPIVTMDSSYDLLDLQRAIHDTRQPLGVDILIRLPKRRRFFRQPPPYSGKGAPRKHGPVFNLGQPQTQGTPDHTASTQEPRCGAIEVSVWDDLHDQHGATLSFSVVRIQAERLPRAKRRPEPLWLAWLGQELLADPLDYWRYYQRRFTVEHCLRFAKSDLGWTTVRPANPAAADRWSWLLVAALWQLWLARSLVADLRLPWESPKATLQLSPGRVRRAIAPILARVALPTRKPHPRGKSPGRRPGERPKSRPPCPTLYRRLKHAA